MSQATENLQKILSKAAPAPSRSNKPLTSPCAPCLTTPRNTGRGGADSVSDTPLGGGGASACASPGGGQGVGEVPLAERLAKANKVGG